MAMQRPHVAMARKKSRLSGSGMDRAPFAGEDATENAQRVLLAKIGVVLPRTSCGSPYSSLHSHAQMRQVDYLRSRYHAQMHRMSSCRNDQDVTQGTLFYLNSKGRVGSPAQSMWKLWHDDSCPWTGRPSIACVWRDRSCAPHAARQARGFKQHRELRDPLLVVSLLGP